MVTDQQVRRLFAVKNRHEYLYQAADAAGMSCKTARKYLKQGKLPSQSRVEHTWPTRQDPFAEDWAFVVRTLEDVQATLDAKTLFEYLQRAYPGKYHHGQLRTFQRRIKAWKALHGPSKEIFFSQLYQPGQWACSDFTSMNKLNITIARQPFEHLFYHFVLCYSNWQAGRICFSESFESLSLGIQDALWTLGGVPLYHRTVTPSERDYWLKPETIIASHHNRGAAELPHRGVKDFGFEQLPFKRFAANSAFYYCMLIAFLLFESFKQDVLKEVIPVTSYATTVRRQFIDIAAKIVTTGHQIILKVSRTVMETLQFATLWNLCNDPVSIPATVYR